MERKTLDMRALRQRGGPGVHVSRIVDHGANAQHDHLFHEIVLVEAGSALHETVAGRQRLRPGDVIVIRPQVWHGYVQPHSLNIINFLFDARLLQRLDDLLRPTPAMLGLFRQRTPRAALTPPLVLHARPAQYTPLHERMEQIMADQRQQPPGWTASVTLAALDVLVQTARLHHGSDDSTPSTQPRTAERENSSRVRQSVLDVAAHLEAHFAQSTTLEQLAELVHLSPGHLSRSFTRQMGLGVVAYQHRLRCEEACRLLRSTDLEISRIAGEVGYDEPAYFSRCFHQQIGRSPRAYRQLSRTTSREALQTLTQM